MSGSSGTAGKLIESFQQPVTNRSVAALIFRIRGVLWLAHAAASLVHTALRFFTSSFGDHDVWKDAVRPPEPAS